MTPEQLEEHADHIVRTYLQGVQSGMVSIAVHLGIPADEAKHIADVNVYAQMGDPAVREMILQSQRDALAGRPWTEARMIKPHVGVDQS